MSTPTPPPPDVAEGLASPGRRRALAATLAGGLALASAAWWGSRGDGSRLDDPGHVYHFLDAADRAVLVALAGALLAGVRPAFSREHGAALAQGVDIAIAGLPLRTRDDLRTLFDLLTARGGRAALLGLGGLVDAATPWQHISPAQAARALAAWRDADLALLNKAYAGLHDLVLGVWYGDPEHWAGTGYAGPPRL